MNVLQLVPKLNVGGVEKGTVEVARFLALKGHRSVVVSGGGKLEKSLSAGGVRHYDLPVGRKNLFLGVYSYFKLKQIIKKENIDLVHARSRIPALIGYFAARHTQRTFITTAHGQYKKHLISRVMGWGKIVIVANTTMARYMNDNFGLSTQKMYVVPRGVDLEKFSFVRPSEKKSKVFRVGMVARYSPIKGHMDFLKAISYVSRKTRNVQAVIMGDIASAKPEYMKELELAARRLAVDKIVEFKDSGEDVASVMGELDVLVSANTSQEAFGRTIIEAQARGVSVVATSVGGVIENVTDGDTGLLCEPMDPVGMAGKIMRYADSVELRDKVALAARRQVEERYSLKSSLELELKAYEEVLCRKNVLVIKISSLGDIILSVPSLRAIRKKFPTAVIKVLVDVRFGGILKGCPYINEMITCDFKGRDKGSGLLKFIERVRSENMDISIDLQNNRRSHLTAFLAAIPERYGYNNGKLSMLLNRKTNLPKKKLSPVEHQAQVLALAGITRVDDKLELWSRKEDEEWVENFLRSGWLKSGQKLVAISVSASRRWETKNWSMARAAELADMLAMKKGIRVVAIGLEEDLERAEEFFKKTSAKPMNAVGKTDIGKLVSLIKRCDALLVGDSAPMHIASALGTPFVAIFGPTDPGRHVALGGLKTVIRKELRCSPCYKTFCNRGLKCMNNVKTGEVFDSLMELMSKELPGKNIHENTSSGNTSQ
jgi:lipopolysaccharide heptosyltransferase II